MPNIKDNLLRMKDISEIMPDLAYSAVFLRDKEIATEVIRLYHLIQELEKETLKMLFKIKEREEELMFIIDLTAIIRELSYNAVRIAKLSQSENAPSIIYDILKNSDKRIIVETISRKSKIANKTITEAEITSKTKASILAVRRKNNWAFKFGDTLKLLPNDQIVAVGKAESEALLKSFLE